jgi:hypothetical protein
MTIAGAWICSRRMERLDVVMLVNLILVLGPITGAFAQSCSRYFEVGGAGQWWTVQTNPDFYQNWSASIQFLPGDCLCKYTETGNFFPRFWIIHVAFMLVKNETYSDVYFQIESVTKIHISAYYLCYLVSRTLLPNNLKF